MREDLAHRLPGLAVGGQRGDPQARDGSRSAAPARRRCSRWRRGSATSWVSLMLCPSHRLRGGPFTANAGGDQSAARSGRRLENVRLGRAAGKATIPLEGPEKPGLESGWNPAGFACHFFYRRLTRGGHAEAVEGATPPLKSAGRALTGPPRRSPRSGRPAVPAAERRAASARAVSTPMPDPPPVTMARRPARSTPATNFAGSGEREAEGGGHARPWE